MLDIKQNENLSVSNSNSNKTKQNLMKLLKIVLPVVLIPICIFGAILFLISTSSNNIQTNNNNNNKTFQNFNTLNLLITNYQEIPISNAKIQIEGKEYLSNTSGSIDIPISNNTNLNFTISHPQFENKEVIINLNDGYSYAIKLTRKGTSEIKGKVYSKSVDQFYDFSQDELYINNTPIKINKNGTFIAGDLSDRKISLEFKSRNFFDLQDSFVLNTGTNNIGEIEVKASGDIIGKFVNYINDEPVNNVNIDVEGIENNKITVQSNNFEIIDLDVNRNYKIRISVPDYSTRIYELNVQQGINSIPNLKMVPQGKISFLLSDNRNTKKTSMVISDLDGENIEEIISGNNISIPNRYISNEQGVMFFVSNHENLFRNRTGTALPIYRYELASKSLERITLNNLENLTNMYTNLKGNFILVYQVENKDKSINLYDHTGRFIKSIYTLEQDEIFNQALIPTNNNNIFFVIKKENIYQLYWHRLDTNETKIIEENILISLETISDNGEVLIYVRKSKDNFDDLVAFYTKDFKSTVLRQNINGKNYRFLNNSDTRLFFINERAGRSTISELNLSTNIEKIILNYNQPDKILYFYQLDQYIVYGNSKYEYIFEIDNPKLNKIIRKL